VLGFVWCGAPLSVAGWLALPLLPIYMAAFAINDIYDQESDRINHPERPLIAYPALSKTVAVVYCLLFLAAITLIIMQDTMQLTAIWAIHFLLLTNYTFVKKYIPLIKGIYVSLTITILLSVLDLYGDQTHHSLTKYLPFGLAFFAREIALDVDDVAGDQKSLATAIGSTGALRLALVLYLASFLLFWLLAESGTEQIIGLVSVFAFFAYWTTKMCLGTAEKRLVPISGFFIGLTAVLVTNQQQP
jgi:4-hydroxybenzoate polyprenyltransferase